MLTIAGLLIAPLVAGSSPRPPKTGVVDSASMTLVVVQNEQKVPVTLYVQNDASDTRIAVISPMTDTTVRIPDYLVEAGEVTFFVHPDHALDESTSPIPVERGEHIGLIVPAKPR